MDTKHQLQQLDVDTAWGIATITAAGDAVVAFEPPTRSRKGAGVDSVAPDAMALSVRALAERVTAYFDGEPVELCSDEQLAAWLDAAGVDGFRCDASRALARVPRGVTLTYGELAEQAGRPRAARAAGSACARNPLPLIVPCHRVVPAAGGLGAYGFHGTAYKARLLKLEQDN